VAAGGTVIDPDVLRQICEMVVEENRRRERAGGKALWLCYDQVYWQLVFAGDGGCFVLGTMLMLTVYAREEHPIRRDQLRWGLLVIGALAFMDVRTVWSGPFDGLPFGENEGGLSDPSVLTEVYGWSLLTLVNRYNQLAHACLALLAVVYLAAIYAQTVLAHERSQLRNSNLSP